MEYFRRNDLDNQVILFKLFTEGKITKQLFQILRYFMTIKVNEEQSFFFFQTYLFKMISF